MMNDFEIYIHIPFCLRKCLYCDFLSFPCGDEKKEEYAAALKKELASRSRLFFGGTASSVFFGGGTPTVLKSTELCGILDCVRENYKLSDTCEITVECNPATSDAEYFRRLLSAGFNRLSIGVQSFDDKNLKTLGRLHSSDEAKRTIDEAFKAGFDNINIDLMSGLPGQTPQDWKKDLRTAAGTGVRHISAYSLIIEEGTWFHDNAGSLKLPTEDDERLMYDMTETVLEEYGLHRYEISNYASYGRECRHNTGYWTGVPYIGIGLGASSYYGERRYENVKDIDSYIYRTNSNDDITICTETLDEASMISEFIILGLRMTKGISPEEFAIRFKKDLFDIYGAVIAKYLSGGFMQLDDGRLRFTRKGLSVSNTILTDFI